jgi:hypothetical protein
MKVFMMSSLGALVGFDTTFVPEGDVIPRTLRSLGCGRQPALCSG